MRFEASSLDVELFGVYYWGAVRFEPKRAPVGSCSGILTGRVSWERRFEVGGIPGQGVGHVTI